MKKLVLVLAVAFSASLFSCGNKAENAAETTDTVATEITDVAAAAEVDTTLLNDSTAVIDTTIAVVAEAVEA